MPYPAPPTPQNHRMVTLTPEERAALAAAVDEATQERVAARIGVCDCTLRKALRGRPVRANVAAWMIEYAADA